MFICEIMQSIQRISAEPVSIYSLGPWTATPCQGLSAGLKGALPKAFPWTP